MASRKWYTTEKKRRAPPQSSSGTSGNTSTARRSRYSNSSTSRTKQPSNYRRQQPRGSTARRVTGTSTPFTTLMRQLEAINRTAMINGLEQQLPINDTKSTQSTSQLSSQIPAKMDLDAQQSSQTLAPTLPSLQRISNMSPRPLFRPQG